MNRFLISLVSLTALIAGPALAQDGTASLTFGYLNVDSGLSDRGYVSLSGQTSVAPTTRLHFDFSRQEREEDATYGALGLSQAYGATTAKVMIGTSTTNNAILPELFLEGSLRHDYGPEVGIVAGALAQYSKYRNGVETTRVGAEMVRFYAPNEAGGYFVSQLNGFLTQSNPGSNQGWEIGGALTYVTGGAWSFGTTASFGNSAYDVAAANVNNRFTSVRPFATYQINENVGVVLRGEYTDTQLYKVQGGSVSLDFAF